MPFGVFENAPDLGEIDARPSTGQLLPSLLHSAPLGTAVVLDRSPDLRNFKEERFDVHLARPAKM